MRSAADFLKRSTKNMGTPQIKDSPSNEIEARRSSLIDSRWKQLYELEKEWGKEAIKYLMLMNAGGSVAILSFIGSSSPLARDSNVSLALIIFFSGIVFAGFMVAYAYESMSALNRGWRKDVESYANNDLAYKKLMERDAQRVPFGAVDRVLGYCSFLCFIGGAISGALALLN